MQMQSRRARCPRTTVTAALLTLTLVAPAAHAGEIDCLADWSRAAAIVKREGLFAIERLIDLAAIMFDGAIVRTTLCKDGERYVYRIVVRDRRGQLSRHAVDARDPLQK